ncbi:ATP-dependent DNA helicase [Robertmurraya sp. GLU-23]
MSFIFTICLIVANWYYIPADSPFIPAEVESIDLNLKDDELAVTFLPLTNGEATLIQNGQGEHILVNTGHQDSEEELKRVLKLYKVNHISTIILTSPEEGYVGNLNMLAEFYDVKQVITSKSIAEKIETIKTGSNEIQDIGIHLWAQGTKQMLVENLEAEVLYNGASKEEGLDLSFTYKSSRFLILTSMTEESNRTLLKFDLSNVNIVKIPQFAVENSINEKLLRHMDPQLAVIFQSKHLAPHQDILKLLQDIWLDVHYTKMHGILTIKFTPKNYEIISISKSEE